MECFETLADYHFIVFFAQGLQRDIAVPENLALPPPGACAGKALRFDKFLLLVRAFGRMSVCVCNRERASQQSGSIERWDETERFRMGTSH